MKQKRNLTSSMLIACLMAALLTPVFLSGCTNAKTLEGSDRDAVLAYSEPIADNLFQGMNSGDYATFSRDFNDQMLKGIPEATFTSSFLPNIVGKLGKYVSRQVDSVTEIGSNVLIVYTAKFEQDDNVTVRLSLEQADPHHVSGLYFSSPTLSQK
ncbi:MAG: DUF3887 domain-containing protein [Chloroflexi bacterium]|nr:DUF3887 domain-containing protein [Chloroflexota bacterium]